MNQELRSKIFEAGKRNYIELDTQVIDEIIQAFVDDGWQKPNEFGQVAYTTMNKDGVTTIVPKQPGLMTKEEWERQAVKDGWVKLEDSQESE